MHEAQVFVGETVLDLFAFLNFQGALTIEQKTILIQTMMIKITEVILKVC